MAFSVPLRQTRHETAALVGNTILSDLNLDPRAMNTHV